jgi:hypothetical protein
MNHCRCGAKLEDDSLHLVPGAAFTPQSKSERRIPQLFILPFEQELPITASYTQGSQRLVTGLKPRPW